jgi:hypothetical protein
MVWVGRVVRDVLVECVHWRALEYEFGHPPGALDLHAHRAVTAAGLGRPRSASAA